MAVTAHDLDRAADADVPTNRVMSIDPINWHRYPQPITQAMLAPAFVRTTAWQGGVYGDDVGTATANVAYTSNGKENGTAEDPTYGPRNQAEKATALGTTLAVDITSPRGYIEPSEPYGAAPVSPTDDPTITSLAPNTAVSNTAPIWVIITGTKFTPWSQVETGNVITPYSKFRSATKMDVLMDPRSSAGTVVVKVVDHGVKSTGSNFTFT